MSGDRILGHRTAKHPTTITKTNIVFRGPSTSSFAILSCFRIRNSRTEPVALYGNIVVCDINKDFRPDSREKEESAHWQLSDTLHPALRERSRYKFVFVTGASIVFCAIFSRRTPADWAGSMWHSRISQSISYADILPSQPPARFTVKSSEQSLR